MPTQIGELGVTFPDNTLQTTAAIAGTSGFGGIQYTQVITASTVWLCPTGVTRVRATVVGGGGGSATNGGDTWPGANGGVAIGVYTVVPGTSYSITVGIGGAGGLATPTSGTTSSFSTFCSATGGAFSGSDQPNNTNGYGSGGNVRNSYLLPLGGGNQTGSNYPIGTSVAPYLMGFSYIGAEARGGFPYSVTAPYGAGLAGAGTCGIGGAVVLEY
jgi:hypothetical protein